MPKKIPVQFTQSIKDGGTLYVTTQVLFKDKVELLLMEFKSWAVQGNLNKWNFSPHFIFTWRFLILKLLGTKQTTNHEFREQ